MLVSMAAFAFNALVARATESPRLAGRLSCSVNLAVVRSNEDAQALAAILRHESADVFGSQIQILVNTSDIYASGDGDLARRVKPTETVLRALSEPASPVAVQPDPPWQVQFKRPRKPGDPAHLDITLAGARLEFEAGDEAELTRGEFVLIAKAPNPGGPTSGEVEEALRTAHSKLGLSSKLVIVKSGVGTLYATLDGEISVHRRLDDSLRVWREWSDLLESSP